MISLKPKTYSYFSCPNCNSSNIEVKKSIFQGIHVLAEVHCQNCGYVSLQDFPIGHAWLYPSKIGVEDKKFFADEKAKWFTKPLFEGFLNPEKSPLKIEDKIYKNEKKIIILNCLDYLYGHSLLRIFNATFYLEKYSNLGLVLIIPKNLLWLVPEGVAEVWAVDISMGKLRNWWSALDDFIQKKLANYEEIYLSRGYSHPDLTQVPIEKYTGITPFNLDNFSEKPMTITFIAREDRLWLATKLYWWAFIALRKLKLTKKGIFRKYFVWHQNQRITKLFKKIKKSFPEATLQVVGLGKSVSFPKWINDERSLKIDAEQEKKWCELYAISQVVIGIHGSNMLLPTAHAIGFVEILPKDRLENLTQDIFPNKNATQAMYLGRFVEEFASIKYVSEQVIAMLNRFERFYHYTHPKYNNYELAEKIDSPE